MLCLDCRRRKQDLFDLRMVETRINLAFNYVTETALQERVLLPLTVAFTSHP